MTTRSATCTGSTPSRKRWRPSLSPHRASGRSAELEALEVALVAPTVQVLEVGVGAGRVAHQLRPARLSRLALVVVVAGRALGGSERGHARPAVEEIHP